jgi:hypothetical protein
MDLIFLSENSRRSMMRGRGYANSLNLEDNKLTLLILTYISQDHAAVASGRSESAAKHRNHPARKHLPPTR